MGPLFFFSIIVSSRHRKDFYAFKVNISDILFYSSSVTVLSEPILGWIVAFVLFSKKPHIAFSRGLRSGLKSCLIVVLTFFLWTFNSSACFLINVVGSFLITVARTIKSLLFFFSSIPHSPFSLKSSFSVEKKFFALYMGDKETLAWFQC